MNTRRQFLLTAPLGCARRHERLRHAGAIVVRTHAPEPVRRVTFHPRRAAHVRHGPGHRAAGVGGDVRRSGEARAGHDASADRELAASSWQRSLAPLLERRTGPRKVALEADVGAGHDLDAVAHRHPSRADARRVRAQPRAARGRCRQATPTSRLRR